MAASLRIVGRGVLQFAALFGAACGVAYICVGAEAGPIFDPSLVEASGLGVLIAEQSLLPALVGAAILTATPRTRSAVRYPLSIALWLATLIAGVGRVGSRLCILLGNTWDRWEPLMHFALPRWAVIGGAAVLGGVLSAALRAERRH